MAGSWHTVEGLALGGSRAISSPHDREGGKHEQKGRGTGSGRAGVVRRELLPHCCYFLRGAQAG